MSYEDANTNVGEADDISSTGDDGTNLTSTEEIDIWADNSELIKSQVADIVNNSESLQDELADVGELADWYIDKGSLDTQAEMTQTSLWPYVVWDTELNNLWSRMSDELDATTKEEVLSEQRRWVSLKEKAANLATIENEGGSIRPMLVNIDLEEYTINRCYKLADIYAKTLNESFTIPEKESGDLYGVYIDDEGTGEIYSSLVVNTGYEGDYDITIELYRLCELTGKGTLNANNEIDFESYDGKVKGVVSCTNNGASFIVSEATDSVVYPEEFYDFELAF